MSKEGIGKVAVKTEAEKANELRQLRDWVKKILPDSYDKYDIAAKYDSAISITENKTAMREDLKVLITDLKSQVEYTKAQQERLDSERKSQAEREVAEYNKSITFDATTDMDGFYATVIRAVNKMCQGYSNLLFVKGRGGIGKSYQIRRALVGNKADFVEIAGDVTEAYLYRLIFDNNGKIIWFKDVVKLLQGLNCLPYYTTVMTIGGVKQIKELTSGEEIASWNFKQDKLEYKKLKVWNAGLKQVVKIRTENGQVLECSPNHKWIVKSNGKIIEKQAKDLNNSDVLLQLK